jgi:hypothetical protein
MTAPERTVLAVSASTPEEITPAAGNTGANIPKDLTALAKHRGLATRESLHGLLDEPRLA